MATGPLRTFLRPPEDEYMQDGDDDAILQELMKRQPRMPGPPLGPRQVPTSKQPGFADFLTQALAGVGDAFSARGGRRTDTFGRVAASQQMLRDRAYQEAMARASAQYEADRLGYEDQWRRYGAEQQGLRGQIDRAMKMRELEMYEQMFKSRKEEQAKKEAAKKSIFSEAAKVKLQEASPDEIAKIKAELYMQTDGNPALMSAIDEAVKAKVVREAAKSSKGPGGFERALMELDQYNFLAPTERGSLKRYPVGGRPSSSTGPAPWSMIPQGYAPAPPAYGYKD